MIVTCEQCHTRFHLADSRIKPSGSKVRCTKCKHIFRIVPASPDNAAEAETPISISDFSDQSSEAVFKDSPSLLQTEIGRTVPDTPSIFDSDATGDTENEFDFSNSDQPQTETVPDFSGQTQFETNQADLPYLDFGNESTDRNVTDEFNFSMDQSIDKTVSSELEIQSPPSEISLEKFEPMDLDAPNLTSETQTSDVQSDHIPDIEAASSDLFEMDLSLESDSEKSRQDISFDDIQSIDLESLNLMSEAKPSDIQPDHRPEIEAASSDLFEMDLSLESDSEKSRQDISFDDIQSIDLESLNLMSEVKPSDIQQNQLPETEPDSAALFEMGLSLESDFSATGPDFSVQETSPVNLVMDESNRTGGVKQDDNLAPPPSAGRSDSSDEIVFQDIEAMGLDDIERLIENRDDSSGTYGQASTKQSDRRFSEPDMQNLDDFALDHLEMAQAESDVLSAGKTASDTIRPKHAAALSTSVGTQSISQNDLVQTTILTPFRDIDQANQTTGPENDAEILEEEGPPALSKTRKTISMPLLILFGIVVVLGGGYAAMTWFPDLSIPFLKEEAPPAIPDAGNLKIKAHDISSKFIDNSTAGKLFVITGKARNEYPESRKQIKITGKLYTRDKKLAKTETVFCGNVISESELPGLTVQAIQERMGKPDGLNQTTAAVKPSESIPFMLVFSDLPDNLDEFTLEIIQSQKG
ncbi:MAG: DUF3426 domain-containing protein [Desulfatirhabdiaceae bacterium]